MKRVDSNIKGGLKLKNQGIDSFDAVMNMINCSGAKLNVLSYSSAYGFIFKLSIPPTAHHCVQFQGLSLKSKTFTNDIYSLVLKLSIINDKEDIIKTRLEIDGESKRKSKENAQAFMNEAKIQQEIFLETIVPSGNPICLGIADYSYLSQTDASKFLDILIDITRINSSSRAVLQYIKTNMETSDKLGIISMELADGYTELNELLYDHRHPNYEHFFSLSIAEIIILFLKTKYINIDFHPKNILINEENGDVRLIDFGRIANVKASGDSGFPNDEKKNEVIRNYNRMFGYYETDRREAIGVDIFNLYGSRISDDTISENLHKIIKFYCCLDFAINNTYYSKVMPQCMEFVKYIYGFGPFERFDASRLIIDKNSKEQFIKISGKIKERITPKMNGRNSMSRDAVDIKMREGKFLIINKKISQYNVKYFPKEKKFKRHPDVLSKQDAAIIFCICCLVLYILNMNFGGARTFSLFRKSINPASMSYAASKLSPNIKNDELKIKKNILKFVVKEIKKLNPCIKIDVTDIDANEIIPMSIEEYEEQIEKYKDSITNTKITADECEINSKIYIPDIDSIFKIIKTTKATKAITHKSRSPSELSRSQSVSELSESQSASEISRSQSASEISRSQSPSELLRSQSVSEISRSLSEGGRRKTRKINNKL